MLYLWFLHSHHICNSVGNVLTLYDNSSPCTLVCIQNHHRHVRCYYAFCTKVTRALRL